MSPRASTTTMSRQRRSGCRPSGSTAAAPWPGQARPQPAVEVTPDWTFPTLAAFADAVEAREVDLDGARDRRTGDDAAALDGVRAFVLDADGVLIRAGEPIDGAFGAVRRLVELGYPYRVVTNFSSAHRRRLPAGSEAG